MRDFEKGLTYENANKLWDADFEKGVLYWREKPCKNVLAGAIAGCISQTTQGYCLIGFNWHDYRRSRLVWLMYYGQWPEKDIDHIDHDRANDCIDNLRLVTHKENMQNQTLTKKNNSGYVNIRIRDTYTKGLRFIVSLPPANGKPWGQKTVDSLEKALCIRTKAYADSGFHLNHGKTQQEIEKD